MVQIYRKSLWWPTVAAILLAVGALLPAHARAADPSLPCPAFSRNGSGGWTVLAPVMMDLGGRIYSPTVGTTFGTGAMADGIEMSSVLDRECGNR
jgi:hypothetical protein